MQVDQPHVAIAHGEPNRRALILPGGGMRVAYQVGAVCALFDRGLRFSFADGTSGGTINLAAFLSGVSPHQLSARWRSLDIKRFVSMRPWQTYLRFPKMGALGDFDGIEHTVFPHLGIDAGKICAARGISATFNLCDFGDKIDAVIPHTKITHKILLAAISLPLMTPPIQYEGKTWTEAVWIKDSNLMATVKAGANELWVIWCIGNTDKFKKGLLEQYVHMIEMSALGALHKEFSEIADLNQRIKNGENPFGHKKPIRVHFIKPEIPLPLDPDFFFGRIDAATLIAYGHRDASVYFDSMKPKGIKLTPASTKMREPGHGIAFREVMTGRIAFGKTDPKEGYKDTAAVPMRLHGSINVRDISIFLKDPKHEGEIVGHLEIHKYGGWLPAMKGQFGLFTPSGDSTMAYMIYDMGVLIDGQEFWLHARKYVRIAMPWKLWPATTTLYITLHKGRDQTGKIVAAGILRLNVFNLLSLLSTFHATGCETQRHKLKAVWGFFRFFAGQLIRIYFLRRLTPV